MKILFLCGSLEPGRDGVGDYTRRLAGELIRQGNKTFIISLNDRYVSEVFKTIQHDDATAISVLRLPSNLVTKKKMQFARKWIDNENPEWLSLQYVPFSFHTKGLPFRLSKLLRGLGKGRKWQIMFHELWL